MTRNKFCCLFELADDSDALSKVDALPRADIPLPSRDTSYEKPIEKPIEKRLRTSRFNQIRGTI